MLLYFLRHADAIYEGERPLSAKGRKQMETVSAFVQRAKIEVQALLTSPHLRARETAELVAPALGVTPCVSKLLDSGLTLTGLHELLKPCPQDYAVMLVGHEPDFSEMIETLTGGQVDMKKAAMALVESDEVAEGAGLLRWLVPPKLM
jgi:phosphohistidine phosphatase